METIQPANEQLLLISLALSPAYLYENVRRKKNGAHLKGRVTGEKGRGLHYEIN
jgi:hypothetical protein